MRVDAPDDGAAEDLLTLATRLIAASGTTQEICAKILRGAALAPRGADRNGALAVAPTASEALRAVTLNPAGKLFSPLEERILLALQDGAWHSTNQLAEAVDESPTGDLRAILRNLQERCYVEVSQRHGVRLAPSTPPPPATNSPI